MCCGKICYTEREANRVINLAHKGRAKFSHGAMKYKRPGKKDIPKRVYHCDNCGMWHTTKLPFYAGDNYKEYEDE
jgi:hypothetical protein